MKVGRLMIETISHGLYGPASERVGVHWCTAALATDHRTLTVGIADMTGPIGSSRGSGAFLVPNTIRPGPRCPTLSKFPEPSSDGRIQKPVPATLRPKTTTKTDRGRGR